MKKERMKKERRKNTKMQWSSWGGCDLCLAGKHHAAVPNLQPNITEPQLFDTYSRSAAED